MSRITGYSYIPQVYQNPKTNKLTQIYLPLIPIRIANIYSQVSPQFDALLDSGSDRNLFPFSIAKYLGISFGKKKTNKVYGIGNNYISAHSAKITLWLGNNQYQTDADFSPKQNVPILGRNGFFNLFKSIKFDEKGQFVYIEEF